MEVPDRSVFIEYLVKKLDANEEKYVSASSVFQQLRGPAISNAPLEDLIPQHGVIHGTGDEDGDFIFVRRGGAFSKTPVADTPRPPAAAASPEVVFWNSIDGSDDPAMYTAYLDQYPDGSFTALARARLQRSEQAEGERKRIARQEAARQEADEQARVAMDERQQRENTTRKALNVLGLAPRLKELAGLKTEPAEDATRSIEAVTPLPDNTQSDETNKSTLAQSALGQLFTAAITEGAGGTKKRSGNDRGQGPTVGVTEVRIALSGSVVGTITKSGKRWESNINNEKTTFKETRRNANSIYLYDRHSKKAFRIDMNTRVVMQARGEKGRYSKAFDVM